MKEKGKHPGSNNNPTKRRFIAVIISVVLILSTLFMLSAPVQAAQGWKWGQTGSDTPGFSIQVLAYGGSKLYAGCGNGIVYENALGGGAWSQTGSDTPGASVLSLAYDGSKLYAGCGNGTVYENALGGGAWSQTGSDTPGSFVYALAYDGSKLYAGCWNGTVYENALGGGPWSQTGSDTPGDIIQSLAYDGSKLYAGGANGTVYENALGGGAWSQTGSNTTGPYLMALAYDGSKLYAGCFGGTVYENALGGGAWSQTGSNTPGSSIFDIAYGGSKLYAGCANGTVYENALGGGPWSQAGSNTTGSCINTLAYDGSKLYAGCDDGTVYEMKQLWKWGQTGSNTPGSSVQCLAYGGSKLYSGHSSGTVYENALGGGAWSQTGSDTPGASVLSLAYDGSKLYAGCGNGTVYENALGGGAWSQTGSDTPGSFVYALAYDGSKLYAGCWNGTVYENALGGGPWSQTGSDTPGDIIQSLAYDGSKLYAGGANGTVYENALGGGAWSQTGSNTTGPYLMALAYDGSKLYAGCFGGTVYENALGGGAWSQTGSNTPGSSIFDIAYGGSKLYAGCANGTVYENALGGGPWSQAGSNTPGSCINSLAYGGSKLYAGCNDGAVYDMKKAYDVDASAPGGNGNVDPAGHVVIEGDNATININPDTGYHTATVTDDGTPVTPTPTTQYVIPSLTSSHEVVATFAINTYDVNASVSGEGGTVDPTSQSVNHGDTAIININPDTGYHTASVTDNGTPVTPTPTTSYTLSNVTANHNVVVKFDTDAPTVMSITPSSGTNNGTVSITDLKGTNFRNGATVQLTGPTGSGETGAGTINATNVNVVSSSKITCSFDLNGSATGSYTIKVTNADGKSGNKAGAFTVNPDPDTWYLAEGTTAWGYDCYITIENPSNESVTAEVTYMTGAGEITGGTVNLPATSQATVNPRDTLGDQDFSTKVECKEGKRIAVDRTMSWTGEGAPSPDGHCSIGVTSPDTTWYLPEGSSAWGFQCWILIQNPNATEATAQVTYMIEGAGPQTFTKTIPANSRKTYNMANDIGEKNASIKVEADKPVIPERAMYRNEGRSGHDSIGTTTPATSYYLAEGTTNYDFTTYVLVQNPQETSTTVNVTYLTTSGEVPHPENPITMEANSRKTIEVNKFLPGTDFSTRVTGSAPIIAERAMYWDYGLGEAAHDSIGMESPHTTFYLPDGQTSNGRETYTLVANPNDSSVTVEISYITPDGTGNVTFQETIGPNSRMTYFMADAGITDRAAVLVTSKTSGNKIMVERAMYWNDRGAGTDTIGGYSD